MTDASRDGAELLLTPRDRAEVVGAQAPGASIPPLHPARGIAVGFAVLVGGEAITGCAIVTDLSTGGYELASSVCDASDDATCEAPVPVFCASSAECSGEICCASASLALPLNFSCQMGPSCTAPVGAQLCGDAGDCDGGPCIAQTCEVLGVLTQIHTCGFGVGLSSFCDAGM